MSWYYAGPDARPVGPVTLEELQQRRWSGVIAPDTYVIEQTAESAAPAAWRHYRDVFPATAPSTTLPPVPGGMPPPPPPVTSPPPPVISTAAVTTPSAHPLFPSAAHAPVHQPPSPLVAAPHAHYPVRQTNTMCAWGFGLGIAGFILTFACGIGVLLALPALLICVLGFVQAQRRPEQSGRGLAVAGGILSLLALLISIGFLAYAVPVLIKNHDWTVTEQSSSNSE
jgi:hypothetical protein